MAQYRKKPVVIEAIQIGEICSSDFDKLPVWIKVAINTSNIIFDINKTGIQIPTLEGVMSGTLGDWLIKGVNNELYPCKPDIFEKTYEKVV